MRSLFVILFSIFFVSGYSQPPGYIPIKGYPYFLEDAKGRIIGADIAGAFSALTADTTSESLVQPPDTFQVFIISEGNAGDTSTLQNGLVAYWSLEETAGATAFDSVASYDGTLTNGPTQNETGISNLCYSFDFNGDEYIDMGNSFWDVGTDDFAVSFWAKYVEAIAPLAVGGILGNFGSTPYWYVRISGGGICAGVINFGGGDIATYANDAGILIEGNWYHVVFQWDRSGTVYAFLNNVLQADQDDISGSVAVDLSNSNTFAVGGRGDWNDRWTHNGSIDEVSVYDRLLTVDEISQLYNVGAGKFWPFPGAGGDSLNMTIEDPDLRADTFRILSKHESYSANRTDGDLEFAFGIADIENYLDTTFAKVGPRDTVEYWSAYSGLIPEDTWTVVANRDTVYRDSSITTPQDPGGFWDTIFYQNLEHRDAPIDYTSGANQDAGLPALFPADFNGETWRNSDNRWPSGWVGLFSDSIVADPLLGSKALKFSDSNIIIQGYESTSSFRGGDSFHVPLNDDNLTEVYFSYNIMFKTGFQWNYGGKLSGLSGGTDVTEGDVPEYGEGFNANIMWFHSDFPGSPVWYLYYQDQPHPPGVDQYPGHTILWEEFQPVGENLNYQEGTPGREAFYFDVTEPIWYNITIRCVVNTFTGTTPIKNGILEGYVNGKLIAQRTDLYLITYPDRETGKFRLFVRYFHGGGGPPLREEWMLMDDFFVFTYDVSVDVPRGNTPSPPGRVLNLPPGVWPKE